MLLKLKSTAVWLVLFFAGQQALFAQSSAPSSSPASTAPLLFVVEIKTGPSWDNAKQPIEQQYFREHSANLKKLRDQGALVLGARYSDKGLVVLQVASAEEAHALMKQDLSIQNQVFAYELHEFSVFYGGTLQAKRRSQ
jgi:hypothetical protein